MATFLAALKARYEGISGSLPGFFSGILKEGSAQTFPNHICLHLGERPEHYEQTGGQGFQISMVVGRARMAFFATSLSEAEGLAVILQTGMEGSGMQVNNDVDVWLFREDYRVTVTRMRGPSGDFVYEAATTYKAMFNPTGD